MDPVAGYLEYLREMARKIAYRGAFLNVLYRKPRRSPDRYLSWDASHADADLQRYLAAVEQDVRAQDGRTLFIGIGLLVGRLTHTGSANIVAAPLLTVPIDIEPPEEAGSTFGYDPQWSAASVNYDLVTAVLEKTDTVDPDDEIGQPNQVAPAAAKAVSDLEVELERQANPPGAEQRLLNSTFAETSMAHLRREIPTFRERITTARVPFRKEDLKPLTERDGLAWFNNRFAFMGSMPDSLSAYEALNDLCASLRDKA